MKEAFGSAANSTHHSSGNVVESDTAEPSKKKAKISGAVCNAAASCNSRATHKNDLTKTFFCKAHYELLSRPARKTLIKIKSWSWNPTFIFLFIDQIIAFINTDFLYNRLHL